MIVDRKSSELQLDPIDTARPSEYMQLFMKLEADHEQLKAACDELCALSMRGAAVFSRRGAKNLLAVLRERTAAVIGDLSAHARWEDEALFPVFTRYYKQEIEPTIQPSLWVLEKDYELAMQFFESFMQASFAQLNLLTLEDGEVGLKFFEGLKEGCNCLTQGCFILNSHFQMEEELIFPLAEAILTDIDYLFS
ncbi:hemerythrin domain-containing protein [Paenibacillus sp. MMS18-CY102]|uniref:hemerythrin domain-containing protein n=1 Tax=Paenibacillus sp. MMS18-CY102 TaxID=2682849 RepID=UPI001365D772|nr:hemerythrin domain-containing protein [Paenibacillus sp. MMS18-CY102]MWC29899.1 hemerythrin [Paenibacillus sp. MMS18-CY102]